MNHNLLKRTILAGSVLSICAAAALGSEARIVPGTTSTYLKNIQRDEARHRVFYIDAGTNELVVVSTILEQVTHRIPIPGNIVDFAISKNHRWMAVIGSGTGAEITLINLTNFQTQSLPSPIGALRTVAFGAGSNTIFVVPSGIWQKIHVIDLGTGQVIHIFGTGPALNNSIYDALLKTNDAGDSLYVLERSQSPLRLTKIRVTNPLNPVFLAENPWATLGSDGVDLAIAEQNGEIYLASGSPYYIKAVDIDSLNLTGQLNTGPYPDAVAIDPLATKVYGTKKFGNSEVYQFDAQSHQLLNIFALQPMVYGYPQPRGIAIDRCGSKAFVLYGKDWPLPALMHLQVVDVDSSSCPQEIEPEQHL